MGWHGSTASSDQIQLPEPTALGAILRSGVSRVNGLLSVDILVYTLGVPTKPGGARHAAEALLGLSACRIVASGRPFTA